MRRLFIAVVTSLIVLLRTGAEEYPFELSCGDQDFVGYIRDMEANEFTAFVSVPCTIPQELLDAAAGGTVSKFTVYSQGDSTNQVAEIVLSGK